MLINKLGEYGLVSRIIKKVSDKKKNPFVVVGPGDDAFAGKLPKGSSFLVTKDVLIEGVHFKNKWSDPFSLGYKAMAVNISDIAAMGGASPIFAFVGLGLTKNVSVSYVDKICKGMKSISSKYGVIISGGDVVSSKCGIVISVTLMGGADKNKIITRSGAKEGDFVMSSGTFGDSALGLEILKRKSKKSLRGYEKALVKRHLMPEPKLKEAFAVTGTGAVNSMIDSSDGLMKSLEIISKMSKKGIEIYLDTVPMSKEFSAYINKNKITDMWDYVLNGAEEYELLFTVKNIMLSKVLKAFPGASVIGRVTKSGGVKYILGQKECKQKKGGFEHFS